MNTKTTMLTENDGDPAALEELVVVEDAPVEKTADADDDRDGDDEPRAERNAASADANEDEREAIRERRRLEKLERKERREKAITRDKIELDFLRRRNEELERRMSAQEQRALQQDLNSVDAQISQALQEARMAEQVIAKAVAAGNGDDVAKAMRYRDEAVTRANQLNAVKINHVNRPVVPAEPQVDPTVVEHAKDFMEEHPWYDVQGRDEDSAVVLAIDSALIRDGYDPKSEAYWAELRKRVARRFPDRKVAGIGRTPRGGPNLGSGREHAPASTRREVYISPERKQALIDAGVWDDPVLRMKYVKRYAEYDRANKA